jgi:hypothetical protein
MSRIASGDQNVGPSILQGRDDLGTGDGRLHKDQVPTISDVRADSRPSGKLAALVA